MTAIDFDNFGTQVNLAYRRYKATSTPKQYCAAVVTDSAIEIEIAPDRTVSYLIPTEYVANLRYALEWTCVGSKPTIDRGAMLQTIVRSTGHKGQWDWRLVEVNGRVMFSGTVER